MNLRQLFILFLLFNLICIAKLSAGAKGAKDSTDFSNYYLLDYFKNASKDDYTLLLDSLKKYHKTDFFRLRAAYTKTDNYNPYSTDENDLFKSVYGKLDSSRYDEAAKIMQTILESNYVNIKAHMICGYIYKHMNDSALSEYHYMVYDGLLNSIIDNGDGISPKTAYIVIDTDEEYSLFTAFGMTSNEQSLMHSDGHSFDLLESVEEKTGKKYNLYFNVDLSFKFLLNQYKDH